MKRKIELIAALVVILSVILTSLLVALKKKTKIDKIDFGNFTDGFDQFASEKEEEPITIQIGGKKKNASLSIGVLTFQEALDFCEKRGKLMPDDIFEIAEEADKTFFDHEKAHDLFVWINASFSVANYSIKAQIKAGPSLNSILEKTWLEFLEKPIWIMQTYRTSKKPGESFLYYNTVEAFQRVKRISFICKEDRFLNGTGEIKIQTSFSIESIPCSPMIITNKFLKEYFSGDNFLRNNVNLFSGLYRKDFNEEKSRLLNLTFKNEENFALSLMRGTLRTVEQQSVRKVICV